MLAIIPARGNSKRFPRKNIALLDGEPLIYWAIEAAKKSGIFDEIIVSTEDATIFKMAAGYAGVVVWERDASLSQDTSRVSEVCLDLLERYNPESFAVLLPTSPLRTAKDIQTAYKIFNDRQADFLLSVTRLEHPPQHALSIASGHIEAGPEINKQSQALEPLYRHDGSIIFARTEPFKKQGDFYGNRTVPFLMPKERAVDINTELDLEWAKFLLQRGKRSECSCRGGSSR